MDYFFQEQRWTDTFLSLHVKKFKRIILFLLIAFSAAGTKAQSDVTFNENIRYSQWVIESRLGDFYGNTNDFGFTTYNRDLTVKKKVTKWKNGSTNPYIDYVPGLVAKATIEAAEYYKNFDWAKPWFKSVEWYGNKCTVPTEPDNLDAINASKMYFGIYALANGSFSSNAESTTASKATTQLGNALSALKHYNETYAFPASTTLNGKDIAGGWFHKKDYLNQMWLDGQYMGPALLAQLINGYSSYTSNKVSDNDWDLIAKQFTIVWNQCWDDTEKLLYHAFSSEALSYWTSDAEIWTTAQADKTKWTKMTAPGHSAAFWGRAEGWYFLALVDVLEQMPTTNANYNTLKNYLTTLADGIKARQDAKSGCWYQLVGKDGSYTASYYNGNSANPKTNYLESSCTAIFAAAYLKAVRLGLLSNDYKTIGENAYKGAVAQFMKQRTDGTVDLLGCCKSAGVGTDALGEAKFRDGSNAYYLHGYDVAPTSTTSNYYTEGKVMGAFIMAATEYERANEKDIRFSYDLAPTYTLAKGGSIKAEALGSGTISYQWFKSGDPDISVATSETFTPTESGTYYCEATSGSTTIKTSKTVVTVNAVSNDVITTGEAIATFANLTSSAPESWTATENKGFTVTGIPSTKEYSELAVYAVKMNYKSTSQDATTITLNVPEGYTVTSLIIKAINASASNTTEITLNGVDTVTIDKVNNAYKEYEVILTNPVTGSSTISITNSGGKELGISQIKVLGYQGTPSSLSITTQPVGATYDYGVSEEHVTDLSVTAEKSGIEGDIAYQWCSNTTNSNTNGTPIDGATSASYKPVVTTAGTTYYYCIASAGGKSVTSEAAAVAVLNTSNLAINTQSNYKKNFNAWTPAVGGTISITDLVTSSSKGAYSITTGDAATLDGKSLTAVKDGTITLKQTADDKYKEGSIEITVRIGEDVTSDGSNAYSFTEATNVSDGMKIARQNITMTFGADGFWKKPSENGYTQGQNNPVVSNNIPRRGTFYKFKATTTGSLSVKVRLGHDGNGKLRPLYVSQNGTLIKAKDKDNKELDPENMPAATTNYEDNITFPVKANTDYYVYVPGSKLGFYGFTFTPATLYTVTFNAGTNGTCSTTSLTQESAGATITLPDATPNTGYTFDGWYDAVEGGNKVTSPYKPERDINLYAHYTATSSGGGATSFSGVVYFTGTETNTSNENVVSVASGNMKSNPGTITYKNVGYSNALKIESSTSVTLTLTAKSKVVLVFNPSNKGNTIKVDGTVHTIGDDGTITVSELGSGTHTITRGNGESYFYAVDIQSTGASLTITTQPASADYLQDATAAALTVAASIVNGTTSEYNFSYQWYSNDKESTTGSTVIAEGSGGKTASCTPDVTDIGTKYYYCVVTAKKGSVELTATSDFAKVTVNGPTVTFTTQPQGAVYKVSDSNVAALTVAATTNFKGDVTYQWYSNDTGKIPNPVDDKEKITNEVSANYTPSINTVGKTYYYCIASSKYNSKDYTAISDLVCVEVVTALYSYNVQGKTKPECNESRSIVDDSGKTLVKFTFGGWKYNNNKYLKPNADDIDANYITDGWSDPATQAKVNALDGYEYAISGKNDAVQEDKTKEITKYKKQRYGWFESPTRDANGVTTDSHPYTLPVRGAYMTFEPTQNGTLTIYLLQNGAWNTFDKDTQLDGVSYKKGDIKPGEFRMHAFQITNQRGLVLAEFAPKYKITVNQKVMDGYECSQCTTDPGEGNYDKTSKDISKWQEFWTLTQAERQAVYDNWKNGNNGSQTIIKLQDGSFLAIQKAIVKYEFHVTGNETYYVFSNFSKLGFSGATFQPDAQPTAKPAEGQISTLELSDVIAYNEITATPKNSNIEGTELKDYTYKIGGTEIAPVAGVYIPQFYSITLKRTFKPNQWTTLSLPFNLTQTEVEQIFGKGTQIIVFDKAEPTSARIYLTFFYHEIQNVLPGYPYLIRPTLVYDNSNSNSADYAPKYTITGGNLTEFTVYNKAINPHINQHEFTSGDYTAKCTPLYCTANVSGNGNSDYSMQYGEGDIFVSESKGTVYISAGQSYGKGYRSYIDYTGTTPPSAKALSISFSGVEDDDDNGTTTDIRIAELADDVIQTLGIGGVYNLNGQKVADTTRNLPAGIYIVNGRKVVVK